MENRQPELFVDEGEDYLSWGRHMRPEQHIVSPGWQGDLPAILQMDRQGRSMLARGLGRSYGDACLNPDGILVDMRRLDHMIRFDRQSGLLQCEAGISLDRILQVAVPAGWFLPVTPGTRYVTVGGAVANDVHGKNHHKAGTFGDHVRAFELWRSDGQQLLCTPGQNSDMFRATIGGMGLTGIIGRVTLQLIPWPSPYLDVETIRFGSVGEFSELCQESDGSWDYTVAWVDCLYDRGIRGHFMRGNPPTGDGGGQPDRQQSPLLSVPFQAPGFLLNPLLMKAFNSLYYHKQRQRLVRRRTHYHPFFYPLDMIGQWNRLYGRRGFFQYQFVLPADRTAVMEDIFRKIAGSGLGSFLAVLKAFGPARPAGLLSFPMEGLTLALDVPNHGERTRRALQQLDQMVVAAGGRIYPAKDAVMTPEIWQQSRPDWKELLAWKDPAMDSGFWRRVTGDAVKNAGLSRVP